MTKAIGNFPYILIFSSQRHRFSPKTYHLRPKTLREVVRSHFSCAVISSLAVASAWHQFP